MTTPTKPSSEDPGPNRSRPILGRKPGSGGAGPNFCL